MAKYLVETYYTCTFKTVHSLNELSEKSMWEIDKRDDGAVEVIEVKLNNRKTKAITDNNSDIFKNKPDEKNMSDISSIVNKKINEDKLEINKINKPKIKFNIFIRKFY